MHVRRGGVFQKIKKFAFSIDDCRIIALHGNWQVYILLELLVTFSSHAAMMLASS